MSAALAPIRGGRQTETHLKDPVKLTSDVPLLTVSNAGKRYGAIQALRNVSFSVAPATVVGLCGHNGAGKSTLVKSLVGLVKLDDGEIRLGGLVVQFRGPQDAQAHGIALVDQELSLVPALSVGENLFLGNINQPVFTRRRRRGAAAQDLLERVGLGHVSASTPVESLRMGERQLVEIARLLGRDSRVLILDEPTASLSDAETQHVFAAIRNAVARGRSVIYVSHRLDEVLTICDSVVVLRDGATVATEAVANLDRARLIELMLGETVHEIPALEERRESDTTVEIRDLNVPGSVRGFDLHGRGGQIFGLAGQVGSGASEVLRALGGLVPNASGVVTLSGRRLRLGSPVRSLTTGAVFVSNDRQGEGLFLGQTTSRNLTAIRLGTLARGGVLSRGRTDTAVQRLAELVEIDPRRLRSEVGNLSGGNQQKVLIGRTLERHGTHLLLLDDPTRGVDVAGRAEIHRLVRHAAAVGAVVVFASTELDELLELSDVIVTMFRGRVVSRIAGADAEPAAVLAQMTHAQEFE
ncbi:MAG TPA: sugar ABC transporter ATP-binding protein [Gaiellaceae bacterium]|jgi:ABC-type sugar transport system ATPase subunit|nr:sugar ABC transporter ATP-binding protein [Gaiellaceae bacterium]